MVKAKSIRRSGRAGCQRLTQAPSSKHSLPVSVSRNPLDALGKGRNPTLQHLIIFQRVSWAQISSTTLHLKKTLIYLIADVFFLKCIHMFSNKLPYFSRRYTCIWTGKSIHCASSENSICLKMSFMDCPWGKYRLTSRFWTERMPGVMLS